MSVRNSMRILSRISLTLFLPSLVLLVFLVPGGIAQAGFIEDLAGASITFILSPVALVSYVALAAAKGVLWVAGVILNFTIFTLVFDFGTYLGGSPGMLLSWSILRDLANILLLFGFVYIGIRMILNVGHFSAGKTLPRLLIFAVLLNFSLFISAAIVDISNGLTAALFAQNSGYECTGPLLDEQKAECLNNGVVGQIMQQVNILSVINGTNQLDIGAQVGSYFKDPVASTLEYLILAILVSTAAAALLAGGFLLITRGIALAFVLVTSPIGFAAMAIEPLRGIAGKWWETLINNALFAPVFLILLFIGLRLTDGLSSLIVGEGGVKNALTTGNTLDAGPLFLFVLVIGFMFAALNVAKQFSIAGAEMAIDLATKAGSTPWIPGRELFGWGSDRASKFYERRVANKIRSVPLLGKPIDDVLSPGIKSGTKIALPGWGTYADAKEHREHRDKHARHEMQHRKHEEHVAHDFAEGLKDARKPEPDWDLLDKVVNSDMSVPELKERLEKNQGVGEVAKILKPSKFRELMGDKTDLDAGVKNRMMRERFGELEDVLDNPETLEAKKVIKKFTADDIEMSGVLSHPERRAALMREVDDSKYEEIIKKDIGPTTREKLKGLRNGTDVGGRFAKKEVAEKTLEGMREPKRRAKLPAKTLAKDYVLEKLRLIDLKEIAVSGDVEPGPERNKLREKFFKEIEGKHRGNLEEYLKTVGGSTAEKIRDFYAEEV